MTPCVGCRFVTETAGEWSHTSGEDHYVDLQWDEVSAGLADQHFPADRRDRTLVDVGRWLERLDTRDTDGRKQSNRTNLPYAVPPKLRERQSCISLKDGRVAIEAES